ncbi:hypothetical protein [Paenibacillus campi]|uniref:hypothetical protein n=1 Tax=Paenibacillus campi TaxID=3106031 RepID=UPI002AFF16F1|nr:hypothetical protein [Paenibacillus sp. SGZ-1009]
MNISLSPGYASTGNLQNYAANNSNPNNTTDPNDPNGTKKQQDSENPQQVQADKAKEQKLKDQKLQEQKQSDMLTEEQKLQKKEDYKKEDKDKEIRQKDLNTLFDKRQEHQKGSSKATHDVLIDSIYSKLGEGTHMAITKDNYEETIKGLINRGFQVSADEERMTISSKVHQLKLEISKDSYKQYVQSVYAQSQSS